LSPRRVVFVTRRFWPLVGGAEKTLARLAAEMAKRGIGVTVLTAGWHPRWPAAVDYRSVRVVRLGPAPRDRLSTLRFVRALARWLRSRRDPWEPVCVSGLRHEAYAAVRALEGRVPVIVRAEASGPDGDCAWQARTFAGRWIRRACLRADAVVAPSRPVGQELIAAGYPEDRIRYVPDGVPIPGPPNPAGKAAAREALAAASPSLNLPPEAILCVYTGRLEWSRGLEGLVAAWAQVVARFPDARLWLAGEGPDEHVLRSQIDARRLGGRVLLAGVFDEIDELLAAADLFALPSAPGGARVALAEAMAAGLPVVAADVAEHRELASDGREALLVAPREGEALAGAITRLLADRPLACRLAAAARTRAIGHFSQSRMADDHLALFNELLIASGS
jgi:glycosyltransferase involved in cell wall biosynthesis